MDIDYNPRGNTLEFTNLFISKLLFTQTYNFEEG